MIGSRTHFEVGICPVVPGAHAEDRQWGCEIM